MGYGKAIAPCELTTNIIFTLPEIRCQDKSALAKLQPQIYIKGGELHATTVCSAIGPSKSLIPVEHSRPNLCPCARSAAGLSFHGGRNMATKVKVNRSAVTGKFVKKEYAKKHPSTTVRETIKKKK